MSYKILKTHPRLSTFNQNRLRSSGARCCFSLVRIGGIGARGLKLYCVCLLPLKGIDCKKHVPACKKHVPACKKHVDLPVKNKETHCIQ